MTKPRARSTAPAWILLLGSVCLAAAPPAGGWQLEPAGTRVGLARVTLEVGELMAVGDRLEGSYELRVRLAPMMSDRGHIALSAAAPLDDLLRRGGRLLGSAHSSEDGRSHTVACDVEPGGVVEIRVDTGKRVLEFRSRVRAAR